MVRTSKQIIVMRKSFFINGKKVTPRKGKYVAQGAHASLKAILNEISFGSYADGKGNVSGELFLKNGSAIQDWICGSFTKVCCEVETEEELLAIYNKAKEAGLITALIVDSGRTEFSGLPTTTCCSVLGWSDELENITGHLKLF